LKVSGRPVFGKGWILRNLDSSGQDGGKAWSWSFASDFCFLELEFTFTGYWAENIREMSFERVHAASR